MFELPKEPTQATRKNPSKLIIFSSPKAGKTEALSRLPNNLILDLEKGTGFIGGMKLDILSISEKEDIKPIQALRMTIDKIKEANVKAGKNVYRFITIDTVSGLEDKFAPDLALKIYKQTPMGRNFQGDDVLTLPNGSGYYYLRLAMLMIVEELEALCETLIISGHIKDKVIDVEGKEVSQRLLDLTGKTSSIICAKSDAIAYLYRKDNQTIANFKTSESLSVGARPEHLKNQEIVLLELLEDGTFQSNWDKIFVD